MLDGNACLERRLIYVKNLRFFFFPCWLSHQLNEEKPQTILNSVLIIKKKMKKKKILTHYKTGYDWMSVELYTRILLLQDAFCMSGTNLEWIG